MDSESAFIGGKRHAQMNGQATAIFRGRGLVAAPDGLPIFDGEGKPFCRATASWVQHKSSAL
jgi:hypothetical protein